MSSYSLSKQGVFAALALLGVISAASAATTFSVRMFAPGVVAPPVVPPPVAHNYAKLMPGTASFSLSADGLSATHMGYHGNGDIIANVGLSTGKWYWEVRRNAGLGAVAIGIATSSATSGAGWGAAPTSTNYGVAYYNTVGFSSTKPNIKNSTMPSSDNDVLGFGLDMDTGTLHVFNNCVEYATWSGWTGTRYPVIASGGGAAGGTLSVNFGASPFVCSVPAGYNAGVWAN